MEFKEYENGIAKYFSKLDITSMPLTIWDFYAEFFDMTKKSVSDANLLGKLATVNEWNEKWNINQKLQNETVIVVTCPKLKIVFASQNILKMNGYTPEELIGNSPKMFQGKATDSIVSREIGNAVVAQQPFEKVVINYRKDGSLYKCHIKGFPVFNTKGELTNFIAFEKAA